MKVGILLSDSFDAFFQYLLLFCGEGDFATLGRTYFSSLISLSCRLIINWKPREYIFPVGSKPNYLLNKWVEVQISKISLLMATVGPGLDFPTGHVCYPEPELSHLAQILDLFFLSVFARLQTLTHVQVAPSCERILPKPLIVYCCMQRTEFYNVRKLIFLLTVLWSQKKSAAGEWMRFFIGFKLKLKPEVGTHLRPFEFEELEGLEECHGFVLD